MPSLFNSFWLGGFESACHINGSGKRLDMIAVTQHDVQVERDYARVGETGISSVREAVRWHLIEHGHLGANSLLLEQNATVGGWCRSIEDNGFTFDYAGHIMFSNDPYVHRAL